MNRPASPTVLVLSPDWSKVAWLRDTLADVAVVLDAAEDAEGLLAQLRDLPGAPLLVDCTEAAAPAQSLAEVALASAPRLKVLGLGSYAEPESMVRAMRLKAQDFVRLDAAPQEARKLVQQHLLAAAPAASAKAGAPRWIAVVSAHPGVGASTLALHLAALAAAQRERGRTLLLDFGQPVGDCLAYTATAAKVGFIEALEQLARCDWHYFDHALPLQHGLRILPRHLGEPGEPRLAPASQLLGILRHHFRLVVADVGAGVESALSDQVVQQADRVLVVAEQSLRSVIATQRLLQRLKGLPPDSVGLVVNRVDDGIGLTPAYIAKSLELPLWATLPERRRALVDAANAATLLTKSTPRDPWVRALHPLVERVAPASDAAGHAGPSAAREGLSKWMSWWPAQRMGRGT